MYEVTVTLSFSSAHRLRNYKGRCENLHGHNWKVEATLGGGKLDAAGMLYDFTLLKASLGKIVSGLDHANLNDLPEFRKKNPTSENLAGHIYSCLAGQVRSGGVRVVSVKVWESEGSHAVFRK